MTSFCSLSSRMLARFLFLANLMLIIALVVFANENEGAIDSSSLPDRLCFKVGKDGLLGFIDTSGKIVTQPAYDYCEMDGWRGGYLWVMTFNKPYSGTFIDRDGVPISDPKFGNLQDLSPGYNNSSFWKGYAWVVLEGGKTAYIDTKANILPDNNQGYPDEKGWVIFSEGGKSGYLDRTGKVAIPARYDFAGSFTEDMAAVRINGRDRLIRRDGSYVCGADYEFVKSSSMNRCLFWVGINGQIGLAEESGKLISDFLFDEFYDGYRVWQGLAFVRKTGGLWTLLDKKGERLTPPAFIEFEKILGWDEIGYMRVTGEGGVGLVDMRGRFQAPCEFDDVVPFVIGKVFVKKNHKWGLIDEDHVFLLEPQFNSVSTLSGQFAIVNVYEPIESDALGVGNYKWNIVSGEGKLLFPFQKGRAWHSGAHNDPVTIGVGQTRDLFNVWQQEYVLPVIYDKIESWGDGLLAVWKGEYVGLVTVEGKWLVTHELMIVGLPAKLCNKFGVIKACTGMGLISDRGEILLPCEFEEIGLLSENLVPAKDDGLWGYVNLEGKWLIKPRFEEAASFLNGYAAVRFNGRTGFINSKGEMKVDFRYEDVGYMLDGRFPFATTVDEKKVWGVADLYGNVNLSPEYDCIEWIDFEPGSTRNHGKPGWHEF
ncbi:MAG: WG repeat-containing protein [Lentisphaerae bacterium]|nr:WG repeat-containing protein [Lentisphaerota bacterium]